MADSVDKITVTSGAESRNITKLITLLALGVSAGALASYVLRSSRKGSSQKEETDLPSANSSSARRKEEEDNALENIEQK